MFRDLWRNGSDGKLERQYRKADGASNESDWDQTLLQGTRLLRADWEAGAEREIEKELLKNSQADRDQLRIELEKDKLVVLAEWESDVQREIDTRKGDWKARVTGSSLESTISNIDKDIIFQAIAQAEQLSRSGENASEKVNLFDGSMTSILSAIRSDWEGELDQKLVGLSQGVSFSSQDERDSFLVSLFQIKKHFLAEYSYEESALVSSYRAQFVAKENENDDLENRIAQETNPSELAILLINRAKRKIQDNYGGILPPDGSFIAPPISAIEGEDYQSKFLKALQDGQSQWQGAIDDLVLGKLRFDDATGQQWKSGEGDWTEAYNQVITAKENWTKTVQAQIQKGLEAWDKSASDLQKNKQKAITELDRTIATNNEQWQAHVRGIENVVSGGADTLATITSNKQFFREALDRANAAGSGYGPGIITEYQNQLNYWTGLETRIRNIVSASQNQIHDQDMRGTEVGQGLLVNAGGSDSFIYTSAELELKIAKEELNLLQQKKDRAQKVYDYAVQNVGNRTAEQIATELETARSAFKTQETAYLSLLAELNGGGDISSSSTGLNPNTTNTGGTATTSGGSILSQLEEANKVLETKRKKLEETRALMEERRAAYESVTKMQVLVNNPQLLGKIGELKTDPGDNKTDSGLRYEIFQASKEIERQREVLRQQEAEMYKLSYERENALRTESFYNETLKKILEFEKLKENKSLLETLLNKSGSLSEKIDSMLSGNNLVTLYGNELSVQMRSNLVNLQTGLTDLDQPVLASADNFSSQVNAVKGVSSSFPIAQLNSKKEDLERYLDKMILLRNSISETNSFDISYIDINKLDQGILYLNQLVSDWNDRADSMRDGFESIEESAQDYLDFATANNAKKGSIEFSNEILSATGNMQESALKVGAFQTYLGEIQKTTGYLNTVFLDSFQIGSATIDSTLTGMERTAAKKTLSEISTMYDSGFKEWSSVLGNAAEPFGNLNTVFAGFGQSVQAFRASLENRSAIGKKASAELLSMYDGFQIEYEGRKTELQFLLNPDGNSETLAALQKSTELHKNLEGARLNEKALEILTDYLKDLSGEEKNIDSVYLKILKDADDRFTNLDVGTDALQERKAMELVLDYVRANRNSLGRSLASADYDEFIEALQLQTSSAAKVRSFYESGGALSESERNSIREGDNNDDKRELSEYYSFGSTFFFKQAIQKVEALDAVVQRFDAFADQVRSGGVLSALRDDYFKLQENKTNGLLKEIHEYVGSLSNLNATDFLQDSFQLGDNTDHDWGAEALRKNLLQDWLSGKTGEQEFLSTLQDFDKLGTIFDAKQAVQVYSETLNYSEDLKEKNDTLQSSLENINLFLGSSSEAPEAVLGLMVDDLRDYYSDRFGEVQNLYNLKDAKDSSTPPELIFKDVDFSPLEQYVSEFETTLEEWSATKDSLKDANDSFLAERSALSSLVPGSPEFVAQVTVVKDKFNALKQIFTETNYYLQKLSSDTVKVNEDARTLLSGMKEVMGLPDKFLVNNNSLPLLPAGIRADYENNGGVYDFQYYATSQGQTVDGLILLDALFARNSVSAFERQNDYSKAASKVSTIESTELGFAQLANAEQSKQVVSVKIEEFRNGLKDRIQVFLGDGQKNQVTQEQLVGYVNQLRTFFLEKQAKGEQVNSSVLEALENAGTFTDEIEKLRFFQGIPNSDRTIASTQSNWESAKQHTTAIKESQTLFRDLQDTLRNLEKSGQPLYTSMDKIEETLKKFDDLQGKLSNKNFTLDGEILTGMGSLRQYAWEAHKSNLAQAFLIRTNENTTVDQFITEVKAGKYILPGQNGARIEKSAKFIGNDLTALQIEELTSYLQVYSDEVKIYSAEINTGIDAILTVTDPEIREELKTQSLASNYDKIQASISQGQLLSVGALPPELKDYAIVTNYLAFLSSNPSWKTSDSADRAAALNEYLLRMGTDNGEGTILSDFLSHYLERNSSYYLKTEKLKERDLLANYYNGTDSQNLKPDDLVGLSNWLKEKKYEDSLVSSLNQAVRMNTILSGYVGDSESEYFSYLGGKLAGGISDSEKQGLVLSQAGLYNPFGFENPIQGLKTEQFLKNFQHKTGFDYFLSKLDGQDLKFTKEIVEADRIEKNMKFSYDILKKNVLVESYLSYLNITPFGQLEPSDQKKIQDRLRELEMQAEQRLGNFLGIVESYSSATFDPLKADANPSIRRALEDFRASGYEIRDAVYEKDSEGEYVFKGGLDNLYGIIENYVDNNLPGRFAVSDPYAETASAKGSMSSSADSIITAGKSIGILTQIAQKYRGKVGVALENALVSDLQVYKDNFNSALTDFQSSEAEFNTQKTAVETIQSNYSAKRQEITVSYDQLENSSKALSELSSVYDFATLLNYSQHQSEENAPVTELKKPKDLAKERLDSATTEVTAKLKEIEEIQKRVDKKTTIAALNADSQVSLNKQQTEDWAERALRFSKAETVIKDRITTLKREIATQRSNLQGQLDLILVPPAYEINANSLNGLLDVTKSNYKKNEKDLRDEYSIVEGILNGKIGAWDFISGSRGSTSPLSYGGGLALKYPEHNILGFVNARRGPGGAASYMKNVTEALDGVWIWQDDNRSYQAAAQRLGSNTYSEYFNNMQAKLWEAIGATSLVIMIMSWGDPTIAIEAINRRERLGETARTLMGGIDDAAKYAGNLKDLQAELNYYTDISTAEQLRTVMLGSGDTQGRFKINTGLVAGDLDYLSGSGKLAPSSLRWEGGKEPLNLDRIAGKNGDPVTQNRYIHDAYGLLIRNDTSYVPGGASATATDSTTKNSDGVKTAFMTSGDEFVSALAVLARAQYDIERDEYYAAQEAFIGPGGQKVDKRDILDDREQFYANLMQNLSKNSGQNIEYEMYRTVISDYMGQGKIVDQLYELNQSQQRDVQVALWDSKEADFFAKKQEWVQNIQFLQDTGNARFNDMASVVLRNWDEWRTDFRKKAKEGEDAHLRKIEKALNDKAKWESDFISMMKKSDDSTRIRDAYNQIQETIDNYSETLPVGVAANLNTNAILNSVLKEAPAKLDEKLLNQGAFQDIQFFIDHLQSSKLDSSNVKAFDQMRKEMDDRTQKMVVLQTLDSLYSIPTTYAETINQANQDLRKQLGQQLMQGGFLPVGDTFIRQTVGPTGEPQAQVLPNYSFFIYTPPRSFPTVKDSEGKEWDLTNYNSLAAKGGPESFELQQMVKLAQNEMEIDFKRIYDPDNPANREIALTVIDPKAMARVQRAATAGMQRLFTDPESALKYSKADERGKKDMEEAAMNSGYLVGPTEGGAFGDHHFTQFYTILKLKEKYDEMKQQGEDLKGDGFSNAVGGVMEVATLGLLDGKQVAKFMHDNKDVVSTIATVAAVIAAPFTGGASLLALAAYNAVQGAYEGGVLGAAAGAISAYSTYTGVEVSYSYDEGFSGSVGLQLGEAVSVGASYSEQAGFGASAGLKLGNFSAGVSYTQSGGFGVDLGLTVGGKNALSGLGLNVSYSQSAGFGAGISYSKDIKGSGGTTKVSAGLSYSDSGGLSGNLSATRTTETKNGANISRTSLTGGISYNRTNGFGANVSATLSDSYETKDQVNGRDGIRTKTTNVNAGLSYSEKAGFGASLSASYSDTFQANRYDVTGRPLAPQRPTMPSLQSISGGLSWNERDGFSGNLDINDIRALSYSKEGGLRGNENFGKELWKAQADKFQKEAQEYTKALADLELQGKKEEWLAGKRALDKYKGMNDEEILAAYKAEMEQTGPKDGSRDTWYEKVAGDVYDDIARSLGFGTSTQGFIDERGNFHPRTCFVAGTLVHTKVGLKPIEQIQVGDEVLSWDEDTQLTEFRIVTELFRRNTDLIYKLSFNDAEIIETTWNHPFWVVGEGWVEVRNLKVNDLVISHDGTKLPIKEITVSERVETVYNFEVSQTHTYFVGENSILVHNQNEYGGYNSATNTVEVIGRRTEFEKARLKYDAEGSYNSTGSVGRFFQRIGNFVTGDGFHDDATLIAQAGNGIENEIEKEHAIAQKKLDLGYQLSNQEEQDYLAYEFKNNVKPILANNPNSVQRVTSASLYGKTMNIMLTSDFCTTYYQCASDPTQSPQGITPEEVVYRHSNTAVGTFLQTAMEQDISYMQVNGLGRPLASGGHHGVPMGSTAFDIQKIVYADGDTKNFMEFPSGAKMAPDDAAGTRMNSDPRLNRFLNALGSNAMHDNRYTQVFSPYGMDYNLEKDGYDPKPNVGGPGNNDLHLNHLHWGMSLTPAEMARDRRARPDYGGW
ncbi:Hint domain-containing protein [Leptospira perolatii]|nr:Hint domain-containing protein [Leptospira perolatii]